MTRRTVLILALAFLLGACSSPGGSGDLFSESALKGAEGRAEVKRYKVERGLLDPNRVYLQADAFVYHDLEREKLRPTALTILKKLRERFADRDWIILRIYDDERASKMLLPLVVAELRDGKVLCSGWTPSDKEIEEAGKDPAALAKIVKGDPRIVFTHPTEEDMNLALDADARLLFRRLKPWGRPSYWEGPALSPEAEGSLWTYRDDEKVERETGAVLNVEPLRVRVARYNVYMYYAGYARGRQP